MEKSVEVLEYVEYCIWWTKEWDQDQGIKGSRVKGIKGSGVKGIKELRVIELKRSRKPEWYLNLCLNFLSVYLLGSENCSS